MKTTYITLKDGCKIYAEYSIKNNHNQTIIYVHGGPGQGCWDFRYAAQKLSKEFNIIMYDQRGVLRSESIDDNFNSNMLIDDIEEIRKHFNLNKIILCGHSYGAQLIVRYNLKYPQYIERLIYICPSFNFKLSLINIFKLWLKFCKDDNDITNIKFCLKENKEKTFLEHLFKMPNDIRNKIYHISKVNTEINSVITRISVTNKDWQKGSEQQKRIFNEDFIYFDYCKELVKINAKSLLIIGEYDPICCNIQKQAFLSNPNTQIVIVKNAGHSVYNDNTKDFVNAIKTYIKE